jgi:TolA-binding protein
MFASHGFLLKQNVILKRLPPKNPLLRHSFLWLALLFALAIPLTAAAQSQPGSNHSANEDPSSTSRANGISSLPGPPSLPDTSQTPQEQARRSAAIYSLLQQDVTKLKEVSAQLQQAVDQSSRDQLSLEVVRLSKQAEALTRRINSEIKQH